MARKQKHYAVWKGRRIGVYSTWDECAAQVSGYPGAQYKAFDSRDAAEEALRRRYEDYEGRPAGAVSLKLGLEIGGPIPQSYCVDAACSGPRGPVEYRCLHTSTRKVIFQQGPFANGTNNVGEFLALVHALALCKREGLTLPIYSDSQDAILWVRQKRCNTRLVRDETNEELFALIERAERWLQKNEYANPVLKWDTEAWGEIPADYGRKQG